MGNYVVAILVIGSLIWDEREHRESWRRDRLKVGPGIPVLAPIRYGRISRDREDTYTMVFSNELLPARQGMALAMLCRCCITTADQLVNEAQALWAAEQSCRSTPGPLSARWGAVGLLPNPARTTLDAIRTGWARRVAEEAKNYAQFPHADGEGAAVNSDGILTIPWPTAESGVPLEVDLLLATATRPPSLNPSYATPEAIAKAWKQAPKQQRYFDENRRAGITTADDDAIIKYLIRSST